MTSYLLYLSLRSPFARRVRLAFEELGCAYETRVVDVFNPTPELLEVNPLARVPALKLASGEVLVESSAILDFLRSRHSNHPLFCDGAYEIKARTLSGLAVGIMELTVASFLETLRGPGLSMPEVRQEYVENVMRALRRVDALLRESSGRFGLSEVLHVADLDLGAAFAYCDLRLGREKVDRYPALRGYFERLSERPSFQKTVPPI